LPLILVEKVDEFQPEATKKEKVVYTRYLIESMLEVLCKNEDLIDALGITLRKMEESEKKSTSRLAPD